MEASNNNQSDVMQLCGVCNAFYGNASTNYLCSKCFRESQSANPINQQAAATTQPTTENSSAEAPTEAAQDSIMTSEPVTTSVQIPAQEPLVSAAASASPEEVKAEEKPVPAEEVPEVKTQTNLNKCWQCSKKVGTLKIPCKCGFVYCPKHRLAESHDCGFDFFQHHQDKLKKDNPLISGVKMGNKVL